MKILITGGAGFIGSHLTERLLQLGHEVTIIDNLSTGSKENLLGVEAHKKFHAVYDTIENQPLLKDLVKTHDFIYHLAAAVGVKKIIEEPLASIKTNIHCTSILLDLVTELRKPTLIASTSEVYGKNPNKLLSEGDDIVLGTTTKLRWSYACSKAIDEFMALAYCNQSQSPLIIVRFFNTVGPRQSDEYGMVIPRFMKQALNGDEITIFGDGSQTRCFCHVLDVVSALVSILGKKEQAYGQVFNIGNTEEINIVDLAAKIIDLTDSSSQLIHIPFEQVYNNKGTFEDIIQRMPDLSKLRDFINYQPQYGLDDILRDVKALIELTHGSGNDFDEAA